MKRISWLKAFWKSMTSSTNRRRAVSTAPMETLEERQLLSVTALFFPQSGELSLTLEHSDSVRVSTVAGNVHVEQSADGINYSTVTSLNTAAAAAVNSIVIVGGQDANTIDLNGVRTEDFTALPTIVVDAGNGHDTIIGSPDLADSIDGGHGNDRISGQGGSDTILGNDGDDTISAGDGNDSVHGGDGQDSIRGDAGDDVINSEDGNDTVSGGSGRDNVFAGNGEDSVHGDAGDDSLNGDGGFDTVFGDDGNDSILGGELADSLLGGAGNDTISGQAGNDDIRGGDGNDSLRGGVGNDLLHGNAGNDLLNGEAGHDRLIGGDDNDTLFGAAGNDSLEGNAGNDTLQGQAGHDTLNGGGGADNLNGGDGNDLVQSLSTGIVINDVKVGEGNSGTVDAVFSVGLTAASAVPVTVTYSTSAGTATNGTDFIPVTNTLTFAPGITTLTVSVSVAGDAINEANETFWLNLSNAVNATIIDGTGLGTILDNDGTLGVGITVGSVVNASQLAGSQTDVQIAVNPTNPLNVVAVGNGGTADPSALFIANSFDGGTTWTTQSLGEDQDGVVATGVAQRFDATVAFDRFGNLHVAYIADPNTTAILRTHAIVHAFSTDGGATFNTQILDGLSSKNDKPGLATGPDAANPATQEAVYVTFRNTFGIAARGATVTSTGSLSVFSTTTNFTTSSSNANDAVPSVGPNGELVVTWQTSTTTQGPANIFVDRDLNGLVGGLTFGTDILVTATEVGGGELLAATPDRGISSSPSLAYDRSGGTRNDRLYLTYADALASAVDNDNTNIFVRFSDNDGLTWSTPVQVNDDTTANSQLLPSIAVDQVTGAVFLSWYDARNDVGTIVANPTSTNTDATDNTEVQVFMSASRYDAAGVLTFVPNVLVSAGVSNQVRDVNNLNDFGSNAGITAHNGVVSVVWADNSNSTTDNPDGATTFDVYTRRVSVTINTGATEQFGRVVGVSQSTVTGGPGFNNSPTTDAFSAADQVDSLPAGSALDDRTGIYDGQELIFSGQDADPQVVQTYSVLGGSQFALSNPLLTSPTIGDSFQIELSQRDVFDVVLFNEDPRVNPNAQPLTVNLATGTFLNAGRVIRFIDEAGVADVNEPVAGQQAALLNNWALVNGQVGTVVAANPNPNKFHEQNGVAVDNKNMIAGSGAGPVASAAGGELDGTLSTQTLRVADLSLTQAPRDENLFVITQASIGTLLPTALATDLGDILAGGLGEDTLVGSTGDDTINGQGGNDLAFGGAGNDSMLGGAGNDTLDGQLGNDTLIGQTGDDVLLGGDNDDTFVLDTNGSGGDSANGGNGLNTIQVNGTNAVDAITVGATGSVLTVGIGAGTIAATSHIQNVVIDARNGNDSVTVGNIAGAGFLVLTVQGGEGNDVIDATLAGGGAVRLSLNGDAGDDLINGSSGHDSLAGGAGNDLLAGYAGNDSITGGLGDDAIGGGFGNDTIDGGNGNDSINGQQGNDSVVGGDGNDSIVGADGNDTLKGGVGDDILNGQAGDDSIEGGVGFDALVGGIGNDTLDGGRNDDTINGNAGNDKIRGDHGNDFINGGTGLETINGGDGNDTIVTSDGSDAIDGGDGNDQISTGLGNDTIVGGDGDDSILSGGGDDIALGGDGHDVINAQGGTDTVAGNQGLDVIADLAIEINEQFVLSAEVLAILKAL